MTGTKIIDKLIGFYPDQLDAVDALCGRKFMTRSEFVRQAVSKSLEAEKSKEKLTELVARIDQLESEIDALKSEFKIGH